MWGAVGRWCVAWGGVGWLRVVLGGLELCSVAWGGVRWLGDRLLDSEVERRVGRHLWISIHL